MNASLARLLDGIVASLREEVIPRLDDPHARGQAIAVVDLVNNLRPRIDWAPGPLAAEIGNLAAAAKAVDEAFSGREERPPACPVEGVPPAGPSAEALLAVRSRLEDHIAGVLAWLADHPDGADALVALRRALKGDLEREVKLVAKPLFGEIAKAAKPPD